ncbi:MAG: hypothetical protein ABSE56_17905 [Bryobacteraceae bacterium]|jgi:hypothetical protein
MANPISYTIKIGTVGELLVQLRLLQYGVQAAPPLKDSGNDLIALRGHAIRCVQVKTGTQGVPKWPCKKKLYHLLAIVHLEGEGSDLDLNHSTVYLLSKEEVDRAGREWEALEGFKLNEQRIKELFCE